MQETKKNRAFRPGCSLSARGRLSPSRGEQLPAVRLQSGRMGNRSPTANACSMRGQVTGTTWRAACQPCGCRGLENLCCEYVQLSRLLKMPALRFSHEEVAEYL